MIAVEDITLILLAAGKSSRYGDIGCKLDETFLGKPLGAHVAVTLEAMPFKERIAIINGSRIDYTRYGFRTVHNDDPAQGMSRSVRLGVACAKASGSAAVLIALADMPRVTTSHIYRMLDCADGPHAVVTSSDGHAPKPPAIFGADQFDFLLDLKGDEGARELVRSGRHVITTPAELIDVDTAEDMERLRALIRSPETITRGAAHRSD